MLPKDLHGTVQWQGFDRSSLPVMVVALKSEL